MARKSNNFILTNEKIDEYLIYLPEWVWVIEIMIRLMISYNKIINNNQNK